MKSIDSNLHDMSRRASGKIETQREKSVWGTGTAVVLHNFLRKVIAAPGRSGLGKSPLTDIAVRCAERSHMKISPRRLIASIKARHYRSLSTGTRTGTSAIPRISFFYHNSKIKSIVSQRPTASSSIRTAGRYFLLPAVNYPG